MAEASAEPSKPAKPRLPPFRVLSLAGGGFLGLYTATVLAELEAWNGAPLGRRFDLIAGTSVGGILALALAFEIPMANVVQIFIQRGQQIFSSRGLPASRMGRLFDLTRQVMGPKYTGNALHKALRAELGERTLADAVRPVVIPAVDVSRSLTKVFKTPHAHGSRGDAHLRAMDVAMATSAAPAFFPSVKIEGRLYADGGLFAVAPDQVALHEAEHFLGIVPRQVRMLSIGTATAGYQPETEVEASDGAVGWLDEGRLLLTLISVQQQHVQAMMEDRLGKRYLRLDAPWPRGKGLGIDIATPAAAELLADLARKSLRSMPLDALRRYFRLAPPGE
ncbi:CBASS cGAMP-activated phospholipase [Pseudomarimonas salicorniae]|uniref:Patatin-like phospholipase family protein n=1 Tax=Pseudomarimonas salicorniae TaxID=2933270 RepID=A0ABT0GKW0_9GAMM|nr:CBASS cGAMP-activated phospholipase [Lysobacter sp. CAU 1642]MCK7595179.1 patatin-like phospholipase family protein [Lysobacter sp. CAU 1642]